jgi:ribose transport system ATP-binding protein
MSGAVPSAPVVVEARGISKSFPGVKALDRVDLVLRRGRLTALLGENGAGKSTLMNILAGVLAPDEGEILLEGRPVRFANPREAREAGIAMIFQELNLVPQLTVAENIFLGREPSRRPGMVDYRRMNAEAARLLERLDLRVSPTVPVGRLRVGQQQVVEIARALSMQARVIIMDEPTSALTRHEVEVLYRIIADLKRQGVAIAYITHKLEELPHVAEDVAVMRDGRMMGTAPLSELTQEDMIRMMVGREIPRQVGGTGRPTGEVVLRVEGLSLRHPGRPGDHLLRNISLEVRRGEVLGIFGLMGAGRTELLETLFGLHPDHMEGRVELDGRPVRIRSPMDAIDLGLALAPEDRKAEGLVLEMSVRENASLACLNRLTRFGFIRTAAERRLVERYLKQLRVKTPSLEQRIRHLSGGNQQKVILARWLATSPRVLLLDEPTRGIDVQAKREIYELIDELARAGLAVIVVSSEMPEILTVSDRIVVLCEGCKTAEFTRAEATEERLMAAALPRSDSPDNGGVPDAQGRSGMCRG